MMGLDNPIHIAFLLIVVLLVFGAKRLPEMGHSLGTGLRGFKEAIGGESTHASLTATEQLQEQSPASAHAPATPTPAAAHTPATPLKSVQDDRIA
jgi:sec-independent protein translocase protein TatA